MSPWWIVHFDHAVSPFPVIDANPWSIFPRTLRAVRLNESYRVGAKVSNRNLVGPWTLVPTVVLIALERVRRWWASLSHLSLKLMTQN